MPHIDEANFQPGLLTFGNPYDASIGRFFNPVPDPNFRIGAAATRFVSTQPTSTFSVGQSVIAPLVSAVAQRIVGPRIGGPSPMANRLLSATQDQIIQVGAEPGCGCAKRRTFQNKKTGACCSTIEGSFVRPGLLGGAYIIGNPCADQQCNTRPVLRHDTETGDWFIACAPPRKKGRMNPFNARALGRAARRISSHARARKTMEKAVKAAARAL